MELIIRIIIVRNGNIFDMKEMAFNASKEYFDFYELQKQIREMYPNTVYISEYQVTSSNIQ
jgi:uncharacterized protein YqfB (UPF0267 family)